MTHHLKRLIRPAQAALMLGLSSAALAVSGVSVDVSRVELSVAAGSSVNHAVTVSNPGKPGEATMQVTGYLSDFLLPVSGEAKYLPAGTSKNSLARWIQVSPPNFNLNPGQEQAVRYTVQVPAGTAPGLYWGVLFFKSDSPKTATTLPQNGVNVNYKVDVGQIIYVQVGPPRFDAKLSEFKVEYDGANLVVNATVKNSGTALLRAAGRAVVVNASGQAVATLNIGESVALPGYSRTFSGHSDLKLPPGQYQVLMALQYAENKRFTSQVALVVK